MMYRSTYKTGLSDDSDFWKEIKAIRKDYNKAVANGTTKRISAYADNSLDEFAAECFGQYKTIINGKKLGWEMGEDTTYSEKVVGVIDKYFKKTSLENSDKSGKLKMDLQYFGRNSKGYKTITLPKDEYAHIMSEINTHMTETERKQKVVTKAIGNYYYTFENNGFDDYRILGKKPIDDDFTEWWDK